MIERYGLEQAQEEAARLQEIARKKQEQRNIWLKEDHDRKKAEEERLRKERELSDPFYDEEEETPKEVVEAVVKTESEPTARMYDAAEEELIENSLKKHSHDGRSIERFSKMLESGMIPNISFIGNTFSELRNMDSEQAAEILFDLKNKGIPKIGIILVEKLKSKIEGEPTDEVLERVDSVIGHSLRKIPEYGPRDDFAARRSPSEHPDVQLNEYMTKTFELLGDTADAMGSYGLAMHHYELAGDIEKSEAFKKIQQEMIYKGKSAFGEETYHTREQKIELLRAAFDRFLAGTRDLPENQVDLEGLLQRALDQFE